jgi:hypothetical protein
VWWGKRKAERMEKRADEITGRDNCPWAWQMGAVGAEIVI